MDKIDSLLTRGVEKIYPSTEALEKVLRGGKKLRLYQGFDPSMPSLHLGNYVGLLKLRQFQDLGHEVIFLVGDFTGMIGDPTDKTATRKTLTREQTLANARAWKDQAGRVLNFSGSNSAKIMFNSAWNDKITFKDLIKICANFTVQQMIERDMYQKRLKENRPIHLHEFLYPVAQAIDCVKMNVDLELGGSDQIFNMLAGRTLMKAMKNKEKFVMATKLLVDAQGQKVGKTTGNALFLDRPADDFFGGIMSFPDEVLPLSFELLTLVPMEKIKMMDFKGRPMELKKNLAYEIVKIIYGEKPAEEAKDNFEKVFQKRAMPADLKTVKIKISAKENTWPDVLLKAGMVKSKSEIKRLIFQRGVDVNGKTITLEDKPLGISKKELVVKIGKTRFLRVKIL